jgi:RNA polymerase sigma-70 factor (ECF subfamily)
MREVAVREVGIGDVAVSLTPTAVPPRGTLRRATGGMSCHTTSGACAAHCRALALPARGAEGRAPDMLARLVERAWPEVRTLVRRSGVRGEDVDDLTQAYFARFIEKDYLRRLETWEGCIRPFLLTTLRHFLSNARDHARAMKRGGRVRTLSLEEARTRTRPCGGLVCTSTPESLLASAERQHSLRRAIAAVAGEVRGEEQSRRLETLLARLVAGESADDREIARRWGVSPVAVRVAAHRLRRRLARALEHVGPRGRTGLGRPPAGRSVPASPGRATTVGGFPALS